MNTTTTTTTENTRPLTERLPQPGKVVMTASQSALKRQIEREAMETARETGRTPRQLADERAELIAFLRAAVPLLNGSFNQEERQTFIPEIEELLTRINS